VTTRHGRGRYTAWQITKAAGGAAGIIALFTLVAAEVAVRRPVMAGCACAVLLFYAGALTWAEATTPIVGRHRLRTHGRHRASEHRREAA
jgi:hypothetical protein